MEDIKTITHPDHPEYRARIVADTSPEPPTDDSAWPIVAIDYFNGWQVETVDLTYTRSGVYSRSSAVEAAAVYFMEGGYDSGQARGHAALDRFERYLRLFHGCTGIDIWESGSQFYVAYDPAEVRERTGTAGRASLGEYRDYLDGLCFGVLVEKATIWLRYGADGRLEWNEAEGHYTTVYVPEDMRVEWEEVESLWGLYGNYDQYPSEMARELLEGVAS